MFKKKFRVIALMLCIVLMMGCFVVNTEAVSTVLLAVQGAIVDGNLVKFSGINGIGVDAGVSAINVVKCKFDATSAPTGNDDVDEGYTVGSRWLDVTNDKSYVCLDNTDGAAVWHLDIVGPGSSTDHAIVRWDSTTGRTVLNSVVTISDAGVVAGGEWQGTVISPVYGGTGIANNVASTWTISGNFAATITVTNITAITLPTAGTLCVTTGTPETTFQIDDDNSGPRLKNSTGEMQIRNAVDDAYANLRALSFYGDGSNLTGVGVAAASALTYSAKAAENINKGQVVYISGASGQLPEVSLADNTVAAKHNPCGVAAETKTTGQTILVRLQGELTSLNTSAFTGGDLLYLSTAGALTKTMPTSGAMEPLARCSYSHASAGKIVIMFHAPDGLFAASADDLVIRLGDDVGGNTLKIKNYANVQLISIDSYGRIWHTVISSAVTGDITGLRTIVTSSAASGGDAPTGQRTRAIYAQVVVAAGKHAGLLQAGLFTASAVAGNVTVYDVHVLCAHYSSGASTVIGGDLYVGYLRAQTRSTDSRAVTGFDVLLALENEAIEGAGAVMDSAIRIFDTNVGGSGFTYGIDMDDAVMATADIRFSFSHTLVDSATGIAISLLSPTTISGLDNVTSTDADYILIWDATDSTLKKCDMGEVRGAGAGYTNLTEFVDQNTWKVFYSDGSGDVIELALGADGTYLESKGAAAAPEFSVPAGAGDVIKVGTPVDNQVGVWTGDGTIEGDASLTYDRSNLLLTGDIGKTGTRITKAWFVNLEVTNDITIGGTALAAIYATIELDNLGTVAINTSLISDTADTDDLGSALKEWRSIYVGTVGKIYLGLSQEISLEVTDANTLYITASVNVSLSGGLIVAGTVALAANNITMTGSIGVTGSRVTKLWTADLECTNDITIGGTALAAIYEGIITGADTLVMFFDGANTPGGEAGFTYIKGTDTLNVVNIACTAISGTLTGTASVAASGDAAVDFFGAGVDAVTDTTECTDIEGTGLAIAGGTLNWAAPNESIDSDAYVDGSIDHEHLAVDIITGWAADTLADADTFLFHDADGADLNKITWTNLMGSIVKVGTIATGTWQGTDVGPEHGGTGVSNAANNTITFTGNFTLGITLTANTSVTFPTSGIIVSDNAVCTNLEGTLLSIAGGDLNAAIPAGHITEAMLDADAVAVGDILTYDDGGVDFLWKTKAELTIASSGANVDITSILNVALYVGRDADNTISFATDNKIIFKTGGVVNVEILATGELDLNAFSAVFTEQVLTSGTAIAWDLGNSNKTTLTAEHNFTITITAPSGALNAQLIITQDGTGSRIMDEIMTQADATVATTDVHTDTEIVDLTIDIPTGARIRIDNQEGTDVPLPLVENTIYWAIRTSENHIQFALTKADAIAGTDIDLTDQGSGTHTVEQLVKWTTGTLGVLTTAAGAEDILSLTYKTGDKQWYAQLGKDFY